MLSGIAIFTPQNAYFQPFSRASEPVKIRNALIYSYLQTLHNSLIYAQTATKSQKAPSREPICKDYSESLVE